MRKEGSFRMFIEKVRVLKQKLEIDDQNSLKKVSSHYEEEEAPVELVSTVEEHYRQIFISAEILYWNSPGNGNTSFNSIAWRRFWSRTLAISSFFSSDLGKFKLVATTNVVSERSRVKTYLRSSMTQGPVSSCLVGTTYKKQVDKLKLVEAASLFCFENDYRFSVKKWILPQKVYRKCW